jgi:hypothetical protein
MGFSSVDLNPSCKGYKNYPAPYFALQCGKVPELFLAEEGTHQQQAGAALTESQDGKPERSRMSKSGVDVSALNSGSVSIDFRP